MQKAQRTPSITIAALVFVGPGVSSPIQLPPQQGIRYQVITIGWSTGATIKVPVDASISSALAYVSHSKPSCQYLIAGTPEKLCAVLSLDPRILARGILLLRGVPHGSFASCSYLAGFNGVETCLFPQGSFCPEAIKPSCVSSAGASSKYQIVNDASRLYRCPDGVSVYTPTDDIHTKDCIEQPGLTAVMSVALNLLQPGQSVTIRGSLGGYYCTRLIALGMKLQILEHVPQLLKLLDQNGIKAEHIVKGMGLNSSSAACSYDATAGTNPLGSHDLSKLTPDAQSLELWYDASAELHIIRADYLAYFGLREQTRKRPVIIWGDMDGSQLQRQLALCKMTVFGLQPGFVLAVPDEAASEFVQAFTNKLLKRDGVIFWNKCQSLSMALVSSGSWPLSIIQAAKNLGWTLVKVFISTEAEPPAAPEDVRVIAASELTRDWMIQSRVMLVHLFDYSGPPIDLPNTVRVVQTDCKQYPDHAIAAPALGTKLTLDIMRQMEQDLYRQ